MEVVASNVQGLDKPREGQPAAPAVGSRSRGICSVGMPRRRDFESDMDYDPFAEE